MIYLAGPLFTQAEQAWLRGIKEELMKHGHEVCWLFELFKDGQISDWGPTAPHRIMERCRKALDKATPVVAWLDGLQVDDGAAWEVG
jgi:nucleoside 2-deoxyribosyltransferase